MGEQRFRGGPLVPTIGGHVSRPLRVGMNLLWLEPGVVGGTEVAAVATIEALLQMANSALDLHLYALDRFARAHEQVVHDTTTRLVHLPSASRAVRVASESTWLPSVMRRDALDVAHGYGGVVPFGVNLPWVVTVHDVQPLEPDASISYVKRRWLAHMIPSSVRRASKVLVPSMFVRDRLCALTDVDPEKVVVIPHGVKSPNHQAHLMEPPLDMITESLVRQRFRLDGPYVLYPAITYPHKNHLVLVEALARIAQSETPPTLVLTGSAGAAESALWERIEQLGVGAFVRRPGRVSHAELHALNRFAALVAFPSRYEGFGLPILEAFTDGTPVVASTAGSLPEVVGNAGVLVDPDDIAGWEAAMRVGMDGGFAGSEQRASRLDQAIRFQWENIVPKVLDVYQTVGG